MALRNLGILWAQYGPYHLARAAALKQYAGAINVHALELGSKTADYAWTRTGTVQVATLCPGEVVERLPFWRVFHRARRIFRELKLDVCILPSYAPKQSLAAFLAAKSMGVRTVMMNESHAGTARTTGAAAFVKRRLVNAFDAALVGGRPQKRYFVSMGLSEKKIFTGYDAVDNQYFAQKAAEVRAEAEVWRAKYRLPPRFFLSLGRFVAKKNLPTLIKAYGQLLAQHRDCQAHLILVGSGEEESRLRGLSAELQLPVYDKSSAGKADQIPQKRDEIPGVHFYGFRQIDENPLFYALSEGFILPSLWEEWGLVVNEAMASGIPVIVSKAAGCAEDLLPAGIPPGIEPGRLQPTLKLDSGLCQDGFVFDPNSVESLAAALFDLAIHPELCVAMGQSGRQVVETVSCENFARNALNAARVAIGEDPSQITSATAGMEPLGLDSRLLP
jgi:glycosyltransferase involved in cell wall biosynthesis